MSAESIRVSPMDCGNRFECVIHCDYSFKCLHLKVIIASINQHIATLQMLNGARVAASLCKSPQFTLKVHQTNECHKLANQFNITVQFSDLLNVPVSLQVKSKSQHSFSFSPLFASSHHNLDFHKIGI